MIDSTILYEFGLTAVGLFSCLVHALGFISNPAATILNVLCLGVIYIMALL